ncbi:unnamed protein product [Ectocarpus sp. 12 AP-2014]
MARRPKAGKKGKKNVEEEKKYATVDVFPDESFRFTIDCHLLVLAETQTLAEDLVFNFQANEEEEVRRSSSAAVSMASIRAMSASVSAAGGAAPMASNVAPGGARGTAAAGKPSATANGPGNTVPPAGGFTSFSFSSRPPNVVVASDGDVPGETGGGEGIELCSTGTGGLEHDDDEPQQLQHRKGFPSREILSAKSLASFQSSPASSVAASTASRRSAVFSRNNSVLRIDEETKEELASLQKQVFRHDRVDWTHALDALKKARTQLDDLDLDQDSTESPPGFFDKVAAVSGSISDALRLHSTSLPPNLTGHIVLVGGSADLQYYILALRRQRPLKPIVVITEDTESFFQLRDRLVECKFLEMSLDISQVYHIFGRTQDRFTLEEANVTQAESVMLMSDGPTDTAVLLGSFELEQVLENIAPGEPRPKVLIDLAKDDSIYYCGTVLGGPDEYDDDPSLAFASTRTPDKGVVCERLFSCASRRRMKPGLGRSTSVRRGGAVCMNNGSGSEDVRYWPLFAAGGVWTTSIMDVFAVRTYFNAHVLSFFETLLQIHARNPPASDNDDDDHHHRGQSSSVLGTDDADGTNGRGSGGGGGAAAAAGEAVSLGEKGSNEGNGEKKARSSHDGSHDRDDDSTENQGRCQFAHLRVSASFAGMTYGDLARHLIALGAMPLGLYRPSGHKGSTLAYTHINPRPDEPLQPWPAAAAAAAKQASNGVGDNKEGSGGGGHTVVFEDGDLGGKWEEKESDKVEKLAGQWRTDAGGARPGDDVFVLRSTSCPLSGEVSL